MERDLSPSRLVAGCMTGTSIDGLDAALVEITGHGLAMEANLVRHIARPLGTLAPQLRDAAEQEPLPAGAFARLAWEFGQLHAAVIRELLDSDPGLPRCDAAHRPRQTRRGTAVQQTQRGAAIQAPRNAALDLICVHGQTVFHLPPVSWQLINPAPIEAAFHCPVISDLRQADLAAGGQGAPITPLADWIMFRHPSKSRAIINLGGFCNVTLLARDQGIEASRHRGHQSRDREGAFDDELKAIRGFDICACNQILDAAARAALQKPFDDTGAAAARGRATPPAAAALHAILAAQSGGGRSLGTGDEAIVWIDHHLKTLPPDDLLASAVDAIARCIGERLRDETIDEAIVAGGGARNRTLVDAISRYAGLPITLSDDHGVPIDAREAMAMAILGTLRIDGVPITLQQVTHRSNPTPATND